MHPRHGTHTDALLRRTRVATGTSITVRHRGDTTFLGARGPLGTDTVAGLHHVVSSALATGPARLVVDMTEVLAGGAPAWWTLHAVADHAHRCGVIPTVVVPDPRVRARLGEVARCGLEIVGASPPSGASHESADVVHQIARPPTDLSAWGIEDLLGRYGSALVRGDAVSAGRCHTEPTFVTEPPTVLTIATRPEIEDSLTRLAVGYRDAGLVSARPSLETATLLGDRYCEAGVLWCHADGDGRRRVHSRYRYLLRRVHRRLATGPVVGYTRINTVTVLERPRLAGPREPC